jgi:phospholipid/cholesterol/gamma-HCH transport system permease protein
VNDVISNKLPSTIEFKEGTSVVLVSGVWRVTSITSFSKRLNVLLKEHAGRISEVRIESCAILDVAILNQLVNDISSYHAINHDSEIKIHPATKSQEQLLALISAKSKEFISERSSLNFIEAMGFWGIEFWKESFSIIMFVIGMLKEIFFTLVYPKRFRFKELISQIDQTGLNAIPICALVTFLIGIVIAYLLGNQLQYYGANIFVVDGIAVAMCRELSPILVAIIVAGRSGSAFAAQLGSMRLNQEVEALQVMGLSSYSVLILPRIMALMITMPILVVVGDVFGILGGMTISYIHLEVSPENFVERLKMVLPVRHLFVGLGKAPLFALFIASIGCRLGLKAAPNAISIGFFTTKTVVQSIVSVILLNAAIAIILSNIGV